MRGKCGWPGAAGTTIAAGDVTIQPGRPRSSSYDLDSAGQHWCVHFTADGAGERIALPLHATGQPWARERMAHIAALHARADRDAVAAAQAELALAGVAAAISAAPTTAAQSAAVRAAAVIDARFAEPLSVAAIAEAARASPAHLARVFRARFGVTVPHRLLQRRVEHARYLLEATDLPIWRVAERVGIPDPQHFNKTVRRLTGTEPVARSGRIVRRRSSIPIVSDRRQLARHRAPMAGGERRAPQRADAH